MLYSTHGFPWAGVAGMARKRQRKLTDQVQLKLRLSEQLRRRLAGEAKRRKQSLNTEIVERLDQSLLNQSGDLDIDAAKALLASLKPTVAAKLAELVMEQEIWNYAVPKKTGDKS
jgi:hypothetical protein